MHTRACTSEEKPPPSKLLPLKHRIIKRGMLQGPITPWARQDKVRKAWVSRSRWGGSSIAPLEPIEGHHPKDLLGSDSATDETGGLTD